MPATLIAGNNQEFELNELMYWLVVVSYVFLTQETLYPLIFSLKFKLKTLSPSLSLIILFQPASPAGFAFFYF